MAIKALPEYRHSTIVVGTSVRKPLVVLKAFLDSLAWQELPPRTKLKFCFVPDFSADQSDAAEYLFRWVNERDGVLLQGVASRADDFRDDGPVTHEWTPSAMGRVGANKDLILAYARETQADFVFLCDADLMIDRTTVASLLASEKPITTAVFWSHWHKTGHETRALCAAPQVWLQHPYDLSGRGMDEAEFRRKLVNRELTRVWGFGACTLLDRRVIESGVSFAYLPDVPREGMMAGEDRHFSIHAERRHIEAYADAWPDIFHLYRPEDHGRIPEMVARLGQSHPRVARTGDLVSLRLRPLEPLPVGPGRYQGLPVVAVRGRLGSIPLAPELEEAAHTVHRGQSALVSVHMPYHHEFPQFRGQTRLIELTLIDVKHNGFAPVLENEMYLGPNSGAFIDYTTLDDQQHRSIREQAEA